MILEIWSAAMMHLLLLSAAIWVIFLCFSALKIAAWCKQIVEVCIAMLEKMMFGSAMPWGKRSVRSKEAVSDYFLPLVVSPSFYDDRLLSLSERVFKIIRKFSFVLITYQL